MSADREDLRACLPADAALHSAASVLGMIPGAALIFFMKNHLARGFSMGCIV